MDTTTAFTNNAFQSYSASDLQTLLGLIDQDRQAAMTALANAQAPRTAEVISGNDTAAEAAEAAMQAALRNIERAAMRADAVNRALNSQGWNPVASRATILEASKSVFRLF